METFITIWEEIVATVVLFAVTGVLCAIIGVFVWMCIYEITH